MLSSRAVKHHIQRVAHLRSEADSQRFGQSKHLRGPEEALAMQPLEVSALLVNGQVEQLPQILVALRPRLVAQPTPASPQDFQMSTDS